MNQRDFENYQKCCGNYQYKPNTETWFQWPSTEMPGFCCEQPVRSCDKEVEQRPNRTTEAYKEVSNETLVRKKHLKSILDDHQTPIFIKGATVDEMLNSW